ncbi:MAG: MFS transporter [Ardenticatenaceae bacterium]|nr:MFS transporter [Ardenticatenaceae bacterium]
MATVQPQTPTTSRNVNPNQLLYTLMIPAIIMPMSGWMFSVSLPIIRDDFGIAADLAAWIATAFTLPFMILMPVYGRISDGLGKRRLLLLGTAIFALGSLLATLSTTLSTLILGRIIQGMGAASLLPLSLALITEVFPPQKRGQAMGLFSSVGPITGVIGPVLAGYIVAAWGWRAAFVPAMLVAIGSTFVIYFLIPSNIQQLQFRFLSTFDWIGVTLLSATLTCLLFYFSSRPITGRPPLQDWRLLLLTILFLITFISYENKKANPFIKLQILQNRSLIIGSVCACLRMLALSGSVSFLMPLYFADIIGLDPTRTGFYLMANPAAMSIMVRFGGNLSDRLGSRIIAMTGFGIISAVMFTFSLLPSHSPHWLIVVLLVVFGTGAGLMLAALHRAALNDVPEPDLGTSSGIYSMIRFLGSACGAAFGGIILQFYLDQESVNLLTAYQHVFQWFVGFALLGLLTATQLPKTK